MEAWLVTWGGMSESAAKDNKIVHILESSKTTEEVAEIIQLLYAHFSYTVEELAHFTEDPSANPYKSQISETAPGYYRILCGHHPWLEARRVKDLSVESSDDNLRETVRWKEQMHSGEWKQEQYTVTQD
jgi:hypothetical protein